MVTLGSEKLPCLSLKSTIISAFLVPMQRAMPFFVSSILAGNGHWPSVALVSCSQFSPRQLLCTTIYLLLLRPAGPLLTLEDGWCVSHITNPARPILSCVPQPPTHEGDVQVIMKKREETASRTTTPPLNTHVGPASFRNFLKNRKSWAL